MAEAACENGVGVGNGIAVPSVGSEFPAGGPGGTMTFGAHIPGGGPGGASAPRCAGVWEGGVDVYRFRSARTLSAVWAAILSL